MAALAVQPKQPIAGFQPVDDDVLKAFAIGKQKADTIVIRAKELEIVWGNDPRYWKYTQENGIDVAELITVCWLDVKGKLAINSPKFVLGEVYSASFIVQRTCEAQNLNNIKLTLELNGGKPAKERVVDLTKIPANTWVALNIADFTAYCDELTVSLTNHSDIWKSGLKTVGIIINRNPPVK